MATHDPMDLDVRSQAFYKDFYHFHKNSCDAWYIKDANHCYVDASLTFASKFMPHVKEPLQGSKDINLLSIPYKYTQIMHRMENEVIVNNNAFSVYAYNYFCKDNLFYRLDMLPFFHHNHVNVLVSVESVFDRIMPVQLLGEFITFDEVSNTLDYSPYYDLDPVYSLSPLEWEITWYMLIGYSQKQIASMLSIESRKVEKITSRVYMKLRVFNIQRLRIVASTFGWLYRIPSRFIDDIFLFKVAL